MTTLELLISVTIASVATYSTVELAELATKKVEEYTQIQASQKNMLCKQRVIMCKDTKNEAHN